MLVGKFLPLPSHCTFTQAPLPTWGVLRSPSAGGSSLCASFASLLCVVLLALSLIVNCLRKALLFHKARVKMPDTLHHAIQEGGPQVAMKPQDPGLRFLDLGEVL